MRFKVRMNYDGSTFAGWQRQLNATTVQELVEDSISTKLQVKTDILGCGRTDAGVHALDFVFHFDYDGDLPGDFLFSVNQMLPWSISIHKVVPVPGTFHARFDAVSRSYVYKIHTQKDPFRYNYSYYFPLIRQSERGIMQKAAELLLSFSQFSPFCKAHSDVKTMKCELKESRWVFDDESDNFEFHISSDRFLRGMVRLIVGATLQVGLGKMKFIDLENALRQQTDLPKPWSVPAKGLALTRVVYPK